jgi:hypothetical protein
VLPHLRLTAVTPDCADPEANLLALGAGRPDEQPDAERYRVLTDPAGHPFCVYAPQKSA